MAAPAWKRGKRTDALPAAGRQLPEADWRHLCPFERHYAAEQGRGDCHPGGWAGNGCPSDPRGDQRDVMSSPDFSTGSFHAMRTQNKAARLQAGDPPGNARGVFYAAAPAVLLVFQFQDRGSSFTQGCLISSIGILHVNKKTSGGGWPLFSRVADHDHAIADADLGMHDPAIGMQVPRGFLRPEYRFGEFNEFFRAVQNKIRHQSLMSFFLVCSFS